MTEEPRAVITTSEEPLVEQLTTSEGPSVSQVTATGNPVFTVGLKVRMSPSAKIIEPFVRFKIKMAVRFGLPYSEGLNLYREFLLQSFEYRLGRGKWARLPIKERDSNVE